MASPEKALADLVYKTCRGIKKAELKKELIESKRIDEEKLTQLDKTLLAQIASCYRKKAVNYLSDILGVI